MPSLSFLLLVLLLRFLPLHSVEEKERHLHRGNCPPLLPCGKLGEIKFPFTKTNQPECGFFVVDDCEDKVNVPKVQLEKGGRWYRLNSISQADTMTIYDEELAKQLKTQDCESLKNLSLPILPHVSFKIHSTLLTICKCNTALSASFLKGFNNSVCKPYTLYFNQSHEMPNDRLSSLCNCPIIQLPFINPPPDNKKTLNTNISNSQNKSSLFYPLIPNISISQNRSSLLDPLSPNISVEVPLFELLTPELSVEVQVSSECWKCHRTRGQCQVNKMRKFYCSKGKKLTTQVLSIAANSKENKQLRLKLGLVITFGIGACIILALCFICFRAKCSSRHRMVLFGRKKPGDHQKIEAFLKAYGSPAPKRCAYSDIKKMTNSFRDKLGQGGYGGVYKGKLLDGRLVAVKVLNKSKGNGEEFINEVATISRTSHVNIVTLLGFCFESYKRALIYEFVPNGSLEKFIYRNNPMEESRRLEWETFYKIAIGIARGLEYLHRGCNSRILHFDIKPHNILLDDNFSPKISDFGLAKLCPRKESIISLTGARGTAGYIAPEVFCRAFGGVSHKSDVYSFGMMVLEMVGGRRNINVEVDRSSQIYFPHWIYERLELDEEYKLWGIANEADKERATKMILVSLWCIQTDPSNRPRMNKVLEMLEGNVDSLKLPPKPFFSSPPR